MVHLIVCDSQTQEFWKMIDGVKTCFGFSSNADHSKYEKAKVDNEVYFLESNGRGVLKAKAKITNIITIDTNVDNYKELLDVHLKALAISKSELKTLNDKGTIYLMYIDDVTLIEPIVYLNYQKLRDFASFKTLDIELFKKVK